MTYRLAICDDEEIIRTVLKKYIHEICQEEHIQVLIESYENPMELLNQIQKYPERYDLIFLDVDMPEINGIETGKRIKEVNEDVLIIFVTAHDKYALKAFEADAFQYMLKPARKDKLRVLLRKCHRILSKINREEQEFINIQEGERYTKVFYKDIIYFEKYKNKVRIICEEQEYAPYLTLRELKEMLNEGPFVQCHQSIIIHKDKITEFKNNKIVILNDKYTLSVSRPYIKAIKNIFLDLLRR